MYDGLSLYRVTVTSKRKQTQGRKDGRKEGRNKRYHVSASSVEFERFYLIEITNNVAHTRYTYLCVETCEKLAGGHEMQLAE